MIIQQRVLLSILWSDISHLICRSPLASVTSTPAPAAPPAFHGMLERAPAEPSYRAPMEKLFYLPHVCSHTCLSRIRPMRNEQYRGKNPLLVPLLYDFRRMTARRRVNRKMGFHVIYKTPCGLCLRTMQEIERYLFETGCDFLFLEMFCLDPYVLVDRKFQPFKPFYYILDITYGKEDVPLSCVNEIDTTPPPQVAYSKERIPGKGVFINTGPEFLVGCDCKDGCRDKWVGVYRVCSFCLQLYYTCLLFFFSFFSLSCFPHLPFLPVSATVLLRPPWELWYRDWV